MNASKKYLINFIKQVTNNSKLSEKKIVYLCQADQEIKEVKKSIFMKCYLIYACVVHI